MMAAENAEVQMPDLRLLSLGAGVQSTTLALLACEGSLRGLDAAVFADTGWEPKAVYDQVNRLADELTRVGIPLHRVSRGNIRTDTIDPSKRFLSLPWYTLAPEGTVNPNCTACGGTGGVSGDSCRRCREGMGRRQCTAEYKLAMINRKARELLGASAPKFRRVPRGRVAQQVIGFSTDEVHRINDRRANRYTIQRYPLVHEFNMSRRDCERWLKAVGWGHTVKSACIGCPMHGNAMWRDMRDNRPDEWAEAVAFDHAIRKGGARGPKLKGEAFLHRSRVPLAQAPIGRITRAEYADMQLDIFDEIAEHGSPDGCSPWGCRSGEPVEV